MSLSVDGLTEASMEEVVGYPTIPCARESVLERSIILKEGRLFMVADESGDIAPPGHCGTGLFHEDTRFLSHYAIEVAGGPPSLLSGTAADVYRAQIDLAVTDRTFRSPGSPADRNVVHLRRAIVLTDRLSERLTLTSYYSEPIDFWVELRTAADFADIFEVRGWRRSDRGRYFQPEKDSRGIDYLYQGVDGKLLRTRVRFLTPTDQLEPTARWTLRLVPGRPQTLEWEVIPDPSGEDFVEEGHRDVESRIATLAGEYDRWRTTCTGWTSDVAAFNATVNQAVVDLKSLYVPVEDGAVVSAGIPWFSTAFGRDSIITSLQTLPVNSRIACDTLLYLARHQGEEENEFTEERPGGIMHEIRRGELARTGEIPHLPYYGTVDATPLWLILLHETWRWTGDERLVMSLLPNAERALTWIDDYGDLDGDGFVEYEASPSGRGLINKGWKDSGDGIPYPDGALPRGPIALVEVQGYVYDAKARMSQLFAALGKHDAAARLAIEAERLRDRIRDRFWLDDLGTFALALDGEKRPIRTATSNAGHLLWSRVPTPDQAARMAATFAHPDMFSGWGIRTLSAVHPAFNPMSYHNGSIWPHDNAIVGLGLCLSGHTGGALQILTGLHDAAIGLRYNRLPELFCGMDRRSGESPVLYPVSCSPQAWASGAMFMLLQAATGILPDAPAGELHIREPLLPPFLNTLTVSGLSIGRSKVTLRFERSGSRTLANLLSMEGSALQVKIELS